MKRMQFEIKNYAQGYSWGWRYTVEVTPQRNKYSREIFPGVWVDVYDVLNAWTVTDPCLQHLIKKALAVGQRGHKDAETDYKDILASSKRALEIHLLWPNKS